MITKVFYFNKYPVLLYDHKIVLLLNDHFYMTLKLIYFNKNALLKIAIDNCLFCTEYILIRIYLNEQKLIWNTNKTFISAVEDL